MFIITAIILVLFASCGFSHNPLEHDLEKTDEDERICEIDEVSLSEPVKPVQPELNEIHRYEGAMHDCRQLPEINEEKLVLDDGCYEGCINAFGNLLITGNGSGKTAVICRDMSANGVITVEKGSNVVIENVSIRGDTRGIFVERESSVAVLRTVISECVKGGINLCGGESVCSSELIMEESVISNVIPEEETGISYGISAGSGKLSVKGSVLTGFSSFGIALWSEPGQKIEAEINNSVISNIYGLGTEFSGHAVYGEGPLDLEISKSEISNTDSTFLYISSDKDAFLKLVDVTLKNILLNSGEQGGIVLDGNIKAQINRVQITDSRGNGVFSKGSSITGSDLSIDSVSVDGLSSNGFGMMLFDGSEMELNRIEISNSKVAGILLDGKCRAEIENFIISETQSDPDILEFGVGAAVQDGAEIMLKNGVVTGNRESGLMAVNGRIELENVLIKNTHPRECAQKNSCVFEPGVPFGHGISLYQRSSLVFSDMTVSDNSNGLNIEDSQVVGKNSMKAVFVNNITAVNAWNIVNFEELEESLLNSKYCGNQTVFTTDVQPVRDGI